MGYPVTVDIRIVQGATFHDVRRWGIAPFVFKPITGATQAAPLVLTVEDHQMPDGWYFAIEDVKGMLRINARKNPPVESDYVRGGVEDANHISVQTINSLDYTPYTGGGVIRYATPADLTLYTDAVFTVHKKDEPDTVLVSRSTVDGVTLDDVNKKIITTIEADATGALDWDCDARFRFELMSPGGEVKRLFHGNAYLVKR